MVAMVSGGHTAQFCLTGARIARLNIPFQNQGVSVFTRAKVIHVLQAALNAPAVEDQPEHLFRPRCRIPMLVSSDQGSLVTCPWPYRPLLVQSAKPASTKFRHLPMTPPVLQLCSRDSPLLASSSLATNTGTHPNTLSFYLSMAPGFGRQAPFGGGPISGYAHISPFPSWRRQGRRSPELRMVKTITCSGFTLAADVFPTSQGEWQIYLTRG